MTTRAVEQQKIATAKLRRDAERTLEEAERNVQHGMLGRGRTKKLDAEAALSRRVIEMRDRQLAKLDEHLTPSRVAPQQDRPPLLVEARSTCERFRERAPEIEL